ncbi:uncharacterized protein LOC21391743 [Morus notabilis]|nr:uncharacterized protein LOC21391743 [Morus notabilis]
MISSLYRHCTFWLERLAMILVAAQHVFSERSFWSMAIAYFALSNMLYLAHLKKLPQKVFLPGSSFYGPNPTEGRCYHFWFRLAVILLASLPLNSVLNLVIENFLYTLLGSFAVPVIVVKFIKPGNLSDMLTYNTPKTLSTRILNFNDTEYLFWFERAVTILLLIAYGINHESAASSWHLAACLFSVTNSVYFINFIELILHVISPNVENAKAEATNECPSKEASNVDHAKDESPSTEASKEDAKAEAKDESPSKEDAETEAKDKSPPKEADVKAKVKSQSMSKQSSEKDQSSRKLGSTTNERLKFYQRTSLMTGATSPLSQNQFPYPFPAHLCPTPLLNTPMMNNIPHIPVQYYSLPTPGMSTQTINYQSPKVITLGKESITSLRAERTKWEAEKKGLTAKLEKSQQLLAKLESKDNKREEKIKWEAEKEDLVANLEKLAKEKSVLMANAEALKQHKDECEEEVEKLKAEVKVLESVSEHDQSMLLVLEQRSKDLVDEKKGLLVKWKKRWRRWKSEKDRLKEKLENAEARCEYYSSVTGDFAEKSLEWDAEKERLRGELCEANERCELYKSLLREGGYGTPKFPSV